VAEATIPLTVWAAALTTPCGTTWPTLRGGEVEAAASVCVTAPPILPTVEVAELGAAFTALRAVATTGLAGVWGAMAAAGWVGGAADGVETAGEELAGAAGGWPAGEGWLAETPAGDAAEPVVSATPLAAWVTGDTVCPATWPAVPVTWPTAPVAAASWLAAWAELAPARQRATASSAPDTLRRRAE
jgi:hypothetical protein